MRLRSIIMILVIFAWPLYYLYDHQLGAVSFLLLALFFLWIAINEMKKLKQVEKTTREKSQKKKSSKNYS